MNRSTRIAFLSCVVMLASPLTAVAVEGKDGDRFVAGSAPQRRPAAPVIKDFANGGEWRKTALAGISEPLPPSLKFLDSQGAWYTPFNRPGMPGYYDLRGLHTVPTTTKR